MGFNKVIRNTGTGVKGGVVGGGGGLSVRGWGREDKGKEGSSESDFEQGRMFQQKINGGQREFLVRREIVEVRKEF